MTENSRPGVGCRWRGATCARLVAAVLAVAGLLGAQAAAASAASAAPAAPAASAAAASRVYMLTQHSAGSVSQLVLAPTGLRFSFSAAVRAGGRSRARALKPFVGIIIRYSGEQLTLLDPIHHTYQVLGLASAIDSYDAELRVLAKAQPSTQLPPAPGTAKVAAGQAKLEAPGGPADPAAPVRADRSGPRPCLSAETGDPAGAHLVRRRASRPPEERARPARPSAWQLRLWSARPGPARPRLTDPAADR